MSQAAVEPEDQNALSADALDSLALPDVYLRLREVMDAEDSSMEDAAEVLSMDPALAARVLRIANSAMYGFRSQVETLSRAAGILGMQKLHDLTLAVSVSRLAQTLHNELMDLETFWYRSVHCGFLARQIAEGAGLRNGESLFVRGLLHDIGHLVLFARDPAACRRALAQADQGFAARLQAERQELGTDAMHLGAQLCRLWLLPPGFAASYEHLLQPEQLEDAALARDTAILQIAVQFTSGMDSDLLAEQIVDHIEPQIWETAGLPPAVGSAALDASNLEMVEAMYRVLTHREAG